MTHDELEQAGFLYADYVPAGTCYTGGDLYVRLTPAGSLRVFVPFDAQQDVELSSGDLYSPDVLYRGPIKDIGELVLLTQRWGRV
ncbi:hypothetical protein [Hymenobacter sp. CRA2]|uniref:hypothetical protein n=1 Tax=Hymenobacter sp. CRA2 TaxID=1955620 RepID=UPI00098F523C|nr:hypothetical protein [Hymenobacter sp. CRA2]OON69440.1 hypothetical protein B0919_09190 [Hymenobacter sp. CRA2]